MSTSPAKRATTGTTGTPPKKRTLTDVDVEMLAESFDVPPSTSTSALSSTHPSTSTSASTSATILITDPHSSSRPKSTITITPKRTGTGMQHPAAPIPVGVLGATGTVGQRFLTLLAAHPWFVVAALGASPRSAGRKYRDAVRWKQSVPIPGGVRDVEVCECRPENFAECKIVFSGLDADVAGEIEEAFRAADLAVFSNAKNFRRDPHVPLIVPLVNPHHLSIIPQQQSLFTPPLRSGFIVTNANCSTTGYVIPLAALEKAFGPLEAVMVTTLQAISGAGYPGVPSLDIMDNVIPYISGEEEKIEWETLKILGGITTSESEQESKEGGEMTTIKTFDMHAAHPLRVSASCNRVPVIDGHTECVSVRFARRPPPSPQQVREALSAYTPDAQTLGCPSAPCKSIVVHEEEDRPQPRLDRYFQDGAGVAVGRVRQCRVLDVKFVVLANNVSIGAATSSIINAEYAVLKNVVQL